MRAGVGEVAAVEVQTALPVPAARKAVELDGNVRNPAQITAGDDFLDLLEVVGEAALLEHQHMHALFLGQRGQLVAFGDGGNERLLGQHVEAGGKKFLRDRKMQVARRGVDDEVDVLALQQRSVIGIGVAARVFACGALAADVERLDDGGDLEALGVLLQMQPVDVAARTALPENCNAYLFHFDIHPFPLRRTAAAARVLMHPIIRIPPPLSRCFSLKRLYF